MAGGNSAASSPVRKNAASPAGPDSTSAAAAQGKCCAGGAAPSVTAVSPGQSQPGQSQPRRSQPGRSQPGRSQPGQSRAGRCGGRRLQPLRRPVASKPVASRLVVRLVSAAGSTWPVTTGISPAHHTRTPAPRPGQPASPAGRPRRPGPPPTRPPHRRRRQGAELAEGQVELDHQVGCPARSGSPGRDRPCGRRLPGRRGGAGSPVPHIARAPSSCPAPPAPLTGPRCAACGQVTAHPARSPERDTQVQAPVIKTIVTGVGGGAPAAHLMGQRGQISQRRPAVQRRRAGCHRRPRGGVRAADHSRCRSPAPTTPTPPPPPAPGAPRGGRPTA